MCVLVAKDLANRWTDIVLLYNEASSVSRDYFGEGTSNSIEESTPKKIKKEGALLLYDW